MITPSYVDYYQNWSEHKDITIKIYNSDNTLYATLTNVDLQSDSLYLNASICDSDNIEFVGCIPSRFEIVFFDSNNIASQLKGKKITVDISVYEERQDLYTPLFSGYIDDCILQSTFGFFKIVAYDVLYSLANVDISDWYSQLPLEFTCGQFRNSLFTHLGITQQSTTLVNDNVPLYKIVYDFNLSALDAIKAICQLNGVFGRIKRTAYNQSEFFEYYKLTSDTSVMSFGSAVNQLEVNGYSTMPINEVKVKLNSAGGWEATASSAQPGDDINTYKIQGNILIQEFVAANLRTIAQNLLTQVSQAPVYQPFKGTVIGNPCVECGDYVNVAYSFNTASGTVSLSYNLLVLSRTLKGIQALKDEYQANGEEFQSLIISDLNQKVENLNSQTASTSEAVDQVEQTLQQTNTEVNSLKNTVAQSVTVNESLVESLTTNLTSTALKPRVEYTASGWEWKDYTENEQHQITYTPCFQTSNTNPVRNYINVEGTKIKFMTEVLTAPADYSKITEAEVVYLTVNGNQLYYTDLSTLSAFTTISPKKFDPNMTNHVEDMYKCRKLKVSGDGTWNIELYANISTVQGQSLTINKVLGIKFDNNANVEYNSTTKTLKTGMIDSVSGREIANVIKPNGNGDLRFYKRINNADYEDFIIAKYSTPQAATDDTNLPDGNFVTITGS